MGVLKRKVSSKAQGFTPYAGDEPPRGVYRGRVVKGAIRKAKEKDTLSYNIMVEFQATKPEHKKFDGYVTFGEIWLGEAEALQAREASFIKAVTGKDDFQNVNVAFTGKEADFASPSGAPITAFDGKKIEGKIVNVEWRWEGGNDGYEGRMRVNSIFPWAASEADEEEAEEIDEDDYEEADEEADDDYEDEGDEEEEGEEDEDLEAEIEERRKELRSRKYTLDDLKKAAKAAGADIKGMKKTDLVEAILDYEFSGEEDEDEDAETEEEADGITEDDIETDEDDDEDEDDEEEDDEDEDEEEDDDDTIEETLRANAADLDRNALKKAIKEKDEAAGFKKSETDDDLRERLVQIWLTNPPF